MKELEAEGIVERHVIDEIAGARRVRAHATRAGRSSPAVRALKALGAQLAASGVRLRSLRRHYD